jgi:hypothetical protein
VDFTECPGFEKITVNWGTDAAYMDLIFKDAVSEERRVKKIIAAMMMTEINTSIKFIRFFIA